jgi:hypothetical protein
MGNAYAFILSVVVLAAASQPATRPKVTLTDAQSRALAEEIVMHTPEHIHFEEGATFSWVLFERQAGDPAPVLTEMVIDLLKKRYVVYLSKDRVPRDQMFVDGGLILLDGFRFSFSIRLIDSETVQVSYSDYEGPEGASSQTNGYKWKESKWVLSAKGPLLVSSTSPNIGLEPTVSRVTLLARERKRRATRPAAQPGRYADIIRCRPY